MTDQWTPEKSQAIARSQGMCGELLNGGLRVCILAPDHGDHKESDDPTFELVARAEELAARAGRATSDCWEMGRHPKTTPMNVDAFSELAVLVRDIARVMKAT